MSNVTKRHSPLRVYPVPLLYKMTSVLLGSNALLYLLFGFLVAQDADALLPLLLVGLVTGVLSLCVWLGMRWILLLACAVVLLSSVITLLVPENSALLLHPQETPLYGALLLLFISAMLALGVGMGATLTTPRRNAL